MKYVLVSLLLVAVAVAQSTPAAQATPSENAQKARALLEQAIQALGGQAWLNVQDMEQEGRSYGFYHGTPQGVGTLFWRFWKYPDKDRIELTKQRDVIYLHNGDQGYEITYKGTAMEEPEATADFVRRQRHSVEVVLRDWLKQPGVALFYDGPAVAEQKPAESVTVMTAQNDAVTLYLDTTNHLPLKRTFTWRDQGRYLNTEDEIYDNYRPEQGVMTPHSIIRKHNGDTTNQRFIYTVKFNTGLADKLFQATITYDPYKRSGPRK